MIFVLVCICALQAFAAAPDFRPPFDKSDYKGTVGVQVNPWFPLNKAPSHALGGPNVPWKHYEGENLWAQGMVDLMPYGITAWVPEINEPTAWTGVWSSFYKQGDAMDVPVKVGMFFGFYSKKNGAGATQDETTRQLQRVFNAVGVDVRKHPRTNRAGGFPVVVVYNVKKYAPEEWGRQFEKIDAAIGRNVYVMDVAALAWMAQTNTQVAAEVDANFERLLRAHLPYWDGISAYANGFRVPYKIIKKVMKDYPQKLYEGMVHQTYTCHFQTGGNEVDLSANWRRSIDECLESDPDAILLTNLFDHYENSIVLPCYDREDFLLRYFECRTAGWRGGKFRMQKRPELVVTGHQSVLIGRQDLDFEVVSFPVDSANKDVVLHLDVCDTSGKVLHSFPARSVRLDGLHVERFSLPSADYAEHRGVVPRLSYEWAGKRHAMNYGPMTLLDPSMRPYRLYWARSTRNELRVNGKNDWRMDDAAPGGTHRPRKLGITQFASSIKAVHQGERRFMGCKRYGVKRDNVEMYFRDDSSKSLDFALTLPTPAPGRALHWYYMEMENAQGLKYQTLPVWETDGSADSRRMVKVPMWKKDGSMADLEVEAVRVPFWHYTMEDDYGRLLVDVSGWGHNGAINGRSGLGGGHLGYTGYNHYHNGPVGMPAKGERTLWRSGGDGKGFLQFNGSNDYLIVQGGTAFPGAFTYEISVRPDGIGREMGLLGTCNNQIQVDILADGRVKAWRASPREGAGGVRTRDEDKWTSEVTSETKLKPEEWSRIAVVYDLRKMTLYVDGVDCGSVASSPAAGHEWLNFLIVGAKCKWVWTPTDRFKGDIGEMRFTGRNLAVAEFLK